MRMRPGSPSELDKVDYRGRWIDDGISDEEDDAEGEDDRPMEDFDPVSASCSATFEYRDSFV